MSYVQGLVHHYSWRVIVGKFDRVVDMYFPALPNCVSMFQNSTGGSSTTSFMLQDHTFPGSLVFDVQKMSIMLILDNFVSWVSI